MAAIVDDQNQVQQSDRSGNVRVSDNGLITLTGGSPADMNSPAPGTALTSSTVTFQWSAGSGVTRYRLLIGSAAGQSDIFQQESGDRSISVSGLPANGISLYVQLGSLIGSTWRTNSYVYRAANLPSGSNLARLVVTSFAAPTSGTIGTNLTGALARFENQGAAPTGAFRLGFYYSRNPDVTTSDLFSGWYCDFSEGIPAGGSGSCGGEVGTPSTLSPGVWYLAAIADDQNRVQQSDRGGNSRTADTGAITFEGLGAAEIISPASGTTFTSGSVTFRWNAGSGAEQFYLAVGSAQGLADIYNQDQGTNLSANISGLPIDGRSLYVRLSSRFGSDWLYNDYSYRAFKAPAGASRRRAAAVAELSPSPTTRTPTMPTGTGPTRCSRRPRSTSHSIRGHRSSMATISSSSTMRTARRFRAAPLPGPRWPAAP